MNEELSQEELAGEQPENSKIPKQLRKYVFKPGISGNPSGRPKGAISMKEYARKYLEAMPEGDRVEFLNSIDPKVIWEMGEGRAKQDMDIDATITGPALIRIDE